MATYTIPQVTVPVGTFTRGPVVLGSAQQAVVTIDRTVAGGLNSLTSSTTMGLDILTSADGGVTWVDEGAMTTVGGVLTDRHGTITANILTIQGLSPGTHAKAVITVGGPSSVVIDGSVVLN